MKKMFSFKNLSISSKFTVSFLVFLIIPLFILFLWINSSVKQRIEAENCKTNLAVLKQTQTSLDDLIENMTYVSLQIIANEELQTLLSKPNLTDLERSQLISDVKYDIGALLTSKEYISSLSVFDEGQIYVQFGKYLLDKPITNLKKTQEQQGRILWVPASVCSTYAFQRDRSYENSMSRTIISHDNYQQVLAYERVSVEEEYLCSLYSGIVGKGTESVFIMDRNGAVISSTNKNMLGRSVAGKEYFSTIKRKSEGYFFTESGKNVVTFYSLSEPEWYVVKIDARSSLAGNGQLDTVIMVCIIIAIIFGIVFYRMQKERIIKPLVQLAGDVSNFHESSYQIGKYSDTNDEIGKLNNSFISMSEYIQDLIEKVYKSQLREKEAQLKYLQSQINPHFLYNTLDSMRWMAVKQKQFELAEQIEALSSLFKHALNEGKEFTTVEKEILHLNDYLIIQKNRFGERLKTEITVQQETKQYVVLNLVLQPLVENAIVHGLENKIGEGKIYVTIKQVEKNLIYIVEDNGLGTDEKIIRSRINNRKESHNALALDNINQRLKCTYGDQYGIEFQSEIGKGTKVTVRMPAERERDDETIDSGR